MITNIRKEKKDNRRLHRFIFLMPENIANPSLCPPPNKSYDNNILRKM